MTLGENLQALRKAAGLSQEEVAGRLFVSRQSVSKWENDQAEPGVETLKALAELYGVTLDRLTGRAHPPEETPADPWDDEEARERRDRYVEEERLRSWYIGLVIGRTVWVVFSNLFSWATYRQINFPFDWIFMLVGLGVRKTWVYWVTVALVCVNLVTNTLFLLSGYSGSLPELAVQIILLVVCIRNETRDYFHLT